LFLDLKRNVCYNPLLSHTHFFLCSGLRGLKGIFLKAALAVDKENVSTVCVYSYFPAHNNRRLHVWTIPEKQTELLEACSPAYGVE
jgi:hypothetical protein